jgi:hypothetical protein
MEVCKACFTIVDGRTSVQCKDCNSHMHKDCAIKEDGAVYCDICYTVKAETPKVIEFNIPESIRRSYIETYRKCPHMFFLEVIEGHESKPTCYTQSGIDLHDLFDKAINDRSYTSDMMQAKMKELFDAYDESLFDFDFKSATRENIWQRIIDSIDTFYNVLPTLDKVYTTEEKIDMSIGEDIPNVNITMDLITEDGEWLDMHDWKSGNVLVGQKLSSDLQAPLYIYLVQEHFKRPVRSFTFYYLKENKTRRFERIDEHNFVCKVGKREYKINLIDAIREVKSIFSQIKKGNFNIPKDTRNMHFTCKICDQRKEGRCEGAYEQSWLQYQ